MFRLEVMCAVNMNHPICQIPHRRGSVKCCFFIFILLQLIIFFIVSFFIWFIFSFFFQIDFSLNMFSFSFFHVFSSSFSFLCPLSVVRACANDNFLIKLKFLGLSGQEAGHGPFEGDPVQLVGRSCEML